MRLRAKFSKRMRMSVDTLAGQFPTDARRAQPGLSVFIWRMSERISRAQSGPTEWLAAQPPKQTESGGMPRDNGLDSRDDRPPAQPVHNRLIATQKNRSMLRSHGRVVSRLKTTSC
jgi:hypothetical protein